MGYLQQLQDSPFTDWLLGSESIWTYPLVLTLHTVGLAILVGSSVVIHLRLLDVGIGIPFDRLRPLYRFIWAGFALNLVTGLMLFATKAADHAVDPVFYIKLTSIFIGLWLGQIAKRRILDPPVITLGARMRARGVAFAGLASWVVAIVAGRLMAYLGS
jgi:hypothetical protein